MHTFSIFDTFASLNQETIINYTATQTIINGLKQLNTNTKSYYKKAQESRNQSQSRLGGNWVQEQKHIIEKQH